MIGYSFESEEQMSTKTQLKLSETHVGRICLHVLTMAQDKKLKWHWKGIVREITAVIII
jgi:hypothetical protein